MESWPEQTICSFEKRQKELAKKEEKQSHLHKNIYMPRSQGAIRYEEKNYS